jgi:acetyl esterase/lipase
MVGARLESLVFCASSPLDRGSASMTSQPTRRGGGAQRVAALRMLRILILASAGLVAMLLGGCRSGVFLLANAPSAFGAYDRHSELSYGEAARQRLDVYAPHDARHRPVVIFWYGGSWTEGGKANYRFVGAALAERGFVAVIPDYRLYPAVTFPAFCEDGAHAIDWVQEHIDEFGGDPERIVLMGHSAGAHIAAFLAFNHEFVAKAGANPNSIVGLVGLSGPYVLVPDTDVLRATFPAPYTNADWQPIRFVDARSPPTLLLHGLNDKEVEPEQSVALHAALAAHHVRVEMHLYAHRRHGDTIAPFAQLARARSSAFEDSIAFIESVTRSDPSP